MYFLTLSKNINSSDEAAGGLSDTFVGSGLTPGINELD
jgi:hypothetical protein